MLTKAFCYFLVVKCSFIHEQKQFAYLGGYGEVGLTCPNQNSRD